MRFPVLADTIKVTSKIGKSGMVLPPVVLRCGGRGSGHSQRHSESEASLSQTTKNSERSGTTVVIKPRLPAVCLSRGHWSLPWAQHPQSTSYIPMSKLAM